MRNYINKNINTSIKWNWEGKKPNRQKIIGLSIFDKKQIRSIKLSNGNLQIWTNGKYQFIKKEIAIKLLEELLKRLKKDEV